MSAAATTQSKLTPVRAPDSGKIVTAEEAVRLIRDGDTVATGGFVGIGFAEEIAVALEAQYLSKDIPASDKPRNLTLVYAAAKAMAKSGGSATLAMKGWCVASSAGTGASYPNCSGSPSTTGWKRTTSLRELFRTSSATSPPSALVISPAWVSERSSIRVTAVAK
jgi:acyl CoA:acetate/3-ketoacid CoA transferase